MADILIGPCRQLITMAGPNSVPRRGHAMRELGIIEGGYVGIDKGSGTIEFVCSAGELDAHHLHPATLCMDASRRVVMPGLIDSHTHLVFGGSRADEFHRRAAGESYQQIAEAGGGIRSSMAATRSASEKSLLSAARRRLKRLLRNGTTAVEIKTGYGLDYESEMKCLRVANVLKGEADALIRTTFMGAHLVPPEFSSRREEYVELVCSMTREIGANRLADFHDIFVDPLAFSHAEAQLIVAAGVQAGLPLKLHADEFGDDGTAAWGSRQHAVSIDHLAGIGDDGIEALAASTSIATLLPGTMFFCGTGMYAPARRMIDAGCAVALASDLNPGSSLIYSMPFVMSLAVLHMGMGPEEVITASTINAAHAMGVAGTAGSLEPGKRADVLIMDIPHYNELPYHIGTDIVHDTIVKGKFAKQRSPSHHRDDDL